MKIRNSKTEKPEQHLADELDEIAKHCACLPVLDARTPDEILGYDEHGFAAEESRVEGESP